MKKYNLSKIMKRAWEIKNTADRKAKNSNWNRNIFRSLEESEKAPFSECLKLAWAEEKRSLELADEYNVTKAASDVMAEEETELSMKEGSKVEVKWNIWTGYGYKRAYYKVSGWAKYRNNKKDNFVSIA